MPKSILIYILDDEEMAGKAIGILLQENGFVNHKIFTDPETMLQSLTDELRILIVDYRLSHAMTGLDVIKEVKKANPQCYVIMVSGLKNYQVIEEYCNTVMRGRYVTKGEKDTAQKIIRFVKEIIEDIKLIRSFYKQKDHINESIKELREIIKGGEYGANTDKPV